MNDWFDWNGTRCITKGIHVLEQPTYTLPAERSAFTAVSGRSGSLTTLEGDEVYDDIVLTATCIIDGENRIPTLSAWLKGGGNVTFANRPGGFYKARIVNQIAFEKILRGNPHRKFAVNFRCQPFWYQSNVPDITITQSTSTVTNPGTVASEPIITVYGSGDITLAVGATIVELTEVNGSITIDSEILECYKGVTGCNAQMSGDFPVLVSGNNAISWIGSVSRVVIQPNWRFL